MTKVLAVTPWNGHGTPSGHACGIANYAAMLQEGLRTGDPDIELVPDADALDPVRFLTETLVLPDVLWLNYHRGLHSRWTPEVLRDLRKMNPRVPVVITFHDTYGDREPDELTRDLYTLADAFVVHEPCQGLPSATLIRQGVPDWQGPMLYDQSTGSWCGQRPILGTCGFNFPWKLYDELAQATAAAGWAFLLCSNNATEADELRWLGLNPHTHVVRGFIPTPTIVSYLAGCDATTVMYRCANSGTSGAIRLCLAARKPLFVAPCRQWNDLKVAEQEWGVHALREVADCSALVTALSTCPIQRVDPATVFVAAQDSWAHQAEKYASLFRSLC